LTEKIMDLWDFKKKATGKLQKNQGKNKKFLLGEKRTASNIEIRKRVTLTTQMGANRQTIEGAKKRPPGGKKTRLGQEGPFSEKSGE